MKEISLHKFGSLKVIRRFMPEPLPMFVKREFVAGRGFQCGGGPCAFYMMRRHKFYQRFGATKYKLVQRLDLIMQDIPTAKFRPSADAKNEGEVADRGR